METSSFKIELDDRILVLIFHPKELKSLPKDKPFIAISNELHKLAGTILEKFLVQNNSVNNFILIEDLLQLPKSLEKTLVVTAPFSSKTVKGVRKAKNLRTLLEKIKTYEAPIVPIHLVAERPISPKSRLVNRKQQEAIQINIRLGKPIFPEAQASFENIKQFRKFIQSKIYALGTNLDVKPNLFRPLKAAQKSVKFDKIAPPIPSDLIATEIKNLSYKNLIATRANFDILVANATEIPNTLQEIGRLRELTFRAVGEGTGKAFDLDEYDLYYKQLLIWDREAEAIVGGYRMGEGDKIFRKYGVEGFYIHSLFKIKKGFHPIMKKSVELGRSYIVPEYQKHRLPLFLLWKGILFFLLRNPHYQYLYGPMSISKYYSDISKGLIIEFVKKYYYDDELAKYLKARNPFRFKSRNVDLDVLMENLDDKIRSLDSFIEDIEPNHFRIPVLLKQYIKLNARFISFNVDPNFSDVLDGFIILNLEDVPYTTIEALQKEV